MVTCEFEDGNQASLRHAVVDGVIIKDGQILLVKRAERLLEGGKWGLPGGYAERDETITQSLAREVKEETGWEIGTPTLLAINSRPDRPGEDRQNITFGFFADATQETGQADDESSKRRWFSPSELPPESEIAFDHYELIELYLEHQKVPQTQPRLY